MLQSKTGATATQYVYALGTRPLAQYGTTPEYLLADALGSVRQIVDANGNVTLAESYEPYGTLLTSTGTANSIFGYSGEQVDTTGLVFLRARYMQPTLGIFLARDPWSGDQMRPGSMNGFGYVEGDPVNATDPSAWCANCIFGTIAQVNDSSGVNLRSMPHVDDRFFMETLPFKTKVFVISPQTFRSFYKKPDDTWASIDWRYVGTPWQTRTTRGWVADDYIESVCHISWPNCPPRDDGGGGPGPDPELSAFRLSQFFKTPYKIINGYGDGLGFQSWLPDLEAYGHNGVDVVPDPEPPVDDTNRCADKIEGREVISPIEGFMTVVDPDTTVWKPETNPKGITLRFTQIPNYPDLLSISKFAKLFWHATTKACQNNAHHRPIGKSNAVFGPTL
jgi:RHS repeat-associated protein